MTDNPLEGTGEKYSIRAFSGDGSQTVWEFSFDGGYISRAHVKIFVTAVDGTITIPTFTWIGDNTINVTPAVATGAVLTIYRDTPKDAPMVNYQDGSILSEINLDRTAEQSIFASAEMVDRFSLSLDGVARSLQLPNGETTTRIPPVGDRASKVLAFDASGRPVAIEAVSAGAAAAFDLHNATFSQAGPGSVIRPVVDKLREIITPEDKGAVADFDGDPMTATDNYVALLAAINEAAARGARLLLTGVYYSSAPIVLVDTYIDWLATTGGGLAFGTTDGLSITQADYKIPTTIRNLDVWTTGQEDGEGFRVAYSAADSITNRTLPRCFIDEISVRGWDTHQHGWLKGAYIQDVHASGIGRMWITGRRDLTAPTERQSFGNMEVGLHYHGTGSMASVPGDAMLDTVHVYNAQDAVRLTGEVEGLSVTGCKLVGVWKGLYSNMSSVRPGFQAYANHINFFDAGIELYQQPQAQLNNNLFYKYVGSDDLSVSIKLTLCDLSYVGQNTHINSTTNAVTAGEFDCVQITDSVDCLVSAQIVEKASRIVHLTGSTVRCRVASQTFAGSAFFTGSSANSAVIDASSGPNFVSGRWASGKNLTPVTVTSAGVDIVSISSPVNVRAGQRFRATATLAFTKGGVSGLLNYSVAKTAGTATVVFYHDASSMSAHSAPDASTSGSIPVDAEMTVTGDGTLQLTMSGVSLGSDTTVATGGGQLTLTEIN